jgi:hypothetical protein
MQLTTWQQTHHTSHHPKAHAMTRHTLFSMRLDYSTLMPSLCAYPRINLFLLVPDSAHRALSRVVSVLNASALYLGHRFYCMAQTSLGKAGV